MVEGGGKRDGRSHYAWVQLKEIVPPHINPNATIESELAKLGKYLLLRKMIVAVNVNQEGPLVWSAIAKHLGCGDRAVCGTRRRPVSVVSLRGSARQATGFQELVDYQLHITSFRHTSE